MPHLKENEICLAIMENGKLVPLAMSKEQSACLELFLAAMTENEPLIKMK